MELVSTRHLVDGQAVQLPEPESRLEEALEEEEARGALRARGGNRNKDRLGLRIPSDGDVELLHASRVQKPGGETRPRGPKGVGFAPPAPLYRTPRGTQGRCRPWAKQEERKQEGWGFCPLTSRGRIG